jgi:hypothetical protein
MKPSSFVICMIFSLFIYLSVCQEVTSGEKMPMPAPAAPDVSEVLQPDGTVINVYLKGDEWLNWVETIDGYNISRGEDGFWYYVIEYIGKTPVLDSVKAHEKAHDGRKKHLRPKRK